MRRRCEKVTIGAVAMPRNAPSHRRALAAALLGAVAVALFSTRVDGVFTIDEHSYVATVTALRDGRLTVPGTEGLPPSPELLAFDAAPRARAVPSTPVSSSSPPLYALFALPFSFGGWPGLIALQILAFLTCAVLVFRLAALHARHPATPWLACGAYVLGAHSIEYAQGVWPHILATALVTGAVACAAHARVRGASWLLFASGALAGLAAGVRYQNIVLGVALGACVFLWSRRRRLFATAAFVAGLTLPLFASSAMNAARLGSWNPVSKGPHYLAVAAADARRNVVVDGLVSTFARVVDYAAWPAPRPSLHEQEKWLAKDARSGRFVLHGAIKKAWLQSSPWLLVVLVGMALAWTRRARDLPARAELRAASILVAAVIGMFALYGFRRDDGWSFNQRYFLELLPIASVALAWLIDELDLGWRAIASAALVTAAALGGALALDLDATVRHRLLAWAPLVLAAGAAALAVLRPRGTALAILLGCCLGWSFAAHVGDDLAASRRIRGGNADRLAAIEAALPPEEPIAVFAYWGGKDALGPLLLDRDLVLVDPWIDRGADARRLLRAFLDRGRRVYVIGGMPREILDPLLDGLRGARTVSRGIPIFRVDP